MSRAIKYQGKGIGKALRDEGIKEAKKTWIHGSCII
jgi:predicted N-acetyltransferase YhbS